MCGTPCRYSDTRLLSVKFETPCTVKTDIRTNPFLGRCIYFRIFLYDSNVIVNREFKHLRNAHFNENCLLQLICSYIPVVYLLMVFL